MTNIQIRSFRAEKLRVTGLLAASAMGRKLCPTIFVKGDESAPIRTVSGVRWLSAAKSWINQDLFIKWVQFEFPFVPPNTILLVFDSARPHISEKVKAFLHSKGILFAVIPGGLTGLLQPCDVSWFKPLKSSLAELIDQWKSGTDHSVTVHGNIKPPTIENMSNWFSIAWDRIGQDTIVRSVDRCFLGDSLFLHIAQHDIYGRLFRHAVADLTSNIEVGANHEVVSEESDPDLIDDE